MNASEATVPDRFEPDLQALIREMAGDPVFARRVIDDPSRFKMQFNLSDRAVTWLKSLCVKDFELLGQEGSLALQEELAPATDICYYFG